MLNDSFTTLLTFGTFNRCASVFNVFVKKPEVMEFVSDVDNLSYVALGVTELKNTL